VSMKTRVKF